MSDLDALARRVEELEKQSAQERAALTEQRDRYKALYQEMLQRCAKLERGIVTQKKSERLPADVVMSEAMLELLLPDRPASESAVPSDVSRADESRCPIICPKSRSSSSPTLCSKKVWLRSSVSAKSVPSTSIASRRVHSPSSWSDEDVEIVREPALAAHLGTVSARTPQHIESLWSG